MLHNGFYDLVKSVSGPVSCSAVATPPLRRAAEVRQSAGAEEARQKFGKNSAEVRQKFGKSAAEGRQKLGRSTARCGSSAAEVWQKCVISFQNVIYTERAARTSGLCPCEAWFPVPIHSLFYDRYYLQKALAYNLYLTRPQGGSENKDESF